MGSEWSQGLPWCAAAEQQEPSQQAFEWDAAHHSRCRCSHSCLHQASQVSAAVPESGVASVALPWKLVECAIIFSKLPVVARFNLLKCLADTCHLMPSIGSRLCRLSDSHVLVTACAPPHATGWCIRVDSQGGDNKFELEWFERHHIRGKGTFSVFFGINYLVITSYLLCIIYLATYRAPVCAASVRR